MNSLGSSISSYLDPDNIQSIVNKVKNAVMNYTEYEIKVRDATGPEHWGASSTLMMAIATGTYNYANFNEIMDVIYKRFSDKTVTWRQIYKSLQLLEYLIKNGSERVVDHAREHVYDLKALTKFHLVDEKGKDQGINVRNRAKEIVDLLSDTQRIKDERKKAKVNRNKYTGVASDGRSISDTSQYTGFGRDTPMRSSTSAGFQDDPDETSPTKASGFENNSQSLSSSTSKNFSSISTSIATASNSNNISKAAPPPPEVVNLLDFDASQPAALSSSTTKTLPQQKTKAEAVDDWSDFTITATTISSSSVSAALPSLSNPITGNLIENFADFQSASTPTKIQQQVKGFADFNSSNALNSNGNNTTSSFTAFSQPQSIATFTNVASFLPPTLSASRQQFSSFSSNPVQIQQQQPTTPSSRDVLGSLVSLDPTSLGSANGGKNANAFGPSLNALKTKQTQVMQQSIGVAGIPMAGTNLGLTHQGNGHAQSFGDDTLI